MPRKVTRFEVSGWVKHAEEDIFNDGCQPDTATVFAGDDHWTADTVEALVAEIQTFVGSKSPDDILWDSCDEPGRVDIQVYEDGDGNTADAHDFAAWKRGHKRLWLVAYSFRVERVTRESISLAPDVRAYRPETGRK